MSDAGVWASLRALLICFSIVLVIGLPPVIFGLLDERKMNKRRREGRPALDAEKGVVHCICHKAKIGKGFCDDCGGKRFPYPSLRKLCPKCGEIEGELYLGDYCTICGSKKVKEEYMVY